MGVELTCSLNKYHDQLLLDELGKELNETQVQGPVGWRGRVQVADGHRLWEWCTVVQVVAAGRAILLGGSLKIESQWVYLKSLRIWLGKVENI